MRTITGLGMVGLAIVATSVLANFTGEDSRWTKRKSKSQKVARKYRGPKERKKGQRSKMSETQTLADEMVRKTA